MDFYSINEQYTELKKLYFTLESYDSNDSPHLLLIKFKGLKDKEEFISLKKFTVFEVFVEYEGTSRELDDFINYIEHPRFNSSLVDSEITIKFDKENLHEDSRIFFEMPSLIKYLNTKHFEDDILDLKNSYLAVYVNDEIESFSTNRVKFINFSDAKLSSIPQSDIYIESSSYKNHVSDSKIPELILSLILDADNLSCLVQKTIITKNYVLFLKLLSTNTSDDISFEIHGKKNIKISTSDDLHPSNWISLKNIIFFLLTGGEFLEKFIIIKNVNSLYLETNTTLQAFNDKLIDIYETSQHYFNHYIQEDLDSFFDLRNTLYKETVNISFALQKHNDRILNYIYGTLLGFILLIATTYLKLLEEGNLIFFLFLSLIITLFSFVIYFTLKKNVEDSFVIIDDQFTFFSNKILILPAKERLDLKTKFILTPYNKVEETLRHLKYILIGLNVLIMTILFIQITNNALPPTIPKWFKIILYLLKS